MKQFGKWFVTDDGIEKGNPNRYFIPKNVLGEVREDESEGTYNWLIQISEKTWASQEDINDLNKAFEFAMGNNLSPDIYKATLKEQKSIIEDKEVSDDGEITIG